MASTQMTLSTIQQAIQIVELDFIKIRVYREKFQVLQQESTTKFDQVRANVVKKHFSLVDVQIKQKLNSMNHLKRREKNYHEDHVI